MQSHCNSPHVGHATALRASRRAADLAAVGSAEIDVLVVGLGVTGAGVALDAASRGLRVVAVDAHDLAFGTSRWSSKLVHGGLRYLASGQIGIARESAVERGILMTRTAPHLTRPITTLLPLNPSVNRRRSALVQAGFWAGDALRAAAHTPREVLPRPQRIGAAEAARLCPSVRRDGLRGALLAHDGQIEDDARLVVALARTAAGAGATILTHTRAEQVTGYGATLRDELTGDVHEVQAKVVVNAAGVWCGQVVPGLTLRPSRGSHLVVRGEAVPELAVALTAPVPGESGRFVFALPQPDGLVYIGLTDEPVDGDVPDVPEATEAEVGFLIETINSVLRTPITRDDVVGTFAGVRPLLDAEGRTADLSRRHAVLVSQTGVVTVVGGKLTTYRRMAQDAVDVAIARAGLSARPCRTRDLPLVGAGATTGAPARLVRKYGCEAEAVLQNAIEVAGQSRAQVLAPLSETVPVTLAELIWGVTHEGAVTVDDLLDRRTRVGLVTADRESVRATAERVLEQLAPTP